MWAAETFKKVGKKGQASSRCHEKLVSDQLDFGDWIPNNCIFVLFQTGDCNGGDRHLMALVVDDDDKDLCQKKICPSFDQKWQLLWAG